MLTTSVYTFVLFQLSQKRQHLTVIVQALLHMRYVGWNTRNRIGDYVLLEQCTRRMCVASSSGSQTSASILTVR